MAQERNAPTIDSFLGGVARETVSAVFPQYYAGLLAWALIHKIESDGWTIHHRLGYRLINTGSFSWGLTIQRFGHRAAHEFQVHTNRRGIQSVTEPQRASVGDEDK
jgi:hypothetical protein